MVHLSGCSAVSCHLTVYTKFRTPSTAAPERALIASRCAAVSTTSHACVRCKTVFKLEVGFQATAQVFHTTETNTATSGFFDLTFISADGAGIALIQLTVDGDRRLSEGSVRSCQNSQSS
jgi:hypothetical protein